MFRILAIGLAAIILALGFTQGARASLLGQTVGCASDEFDCSPPTAVVVNAGNPEFLLSQQLSNIAFTIDVDDSSFTVTNISGFEIMNFSFQVDLSDLIWAESPGTPIDNVLLSDFTPGYDVINLPSVYRRQFSSSFIPNFVVRFLSGMG